MEQNCTEQILNDVVRVDLVPASDCHLPVPFSVMQTKMNIPNLSNWKPQTAIAALGAAVLSVAYSVQDGDDGVMEEAPRLKQTPKTTMSGEVISHDLQVPITQGFEATEIAANLLHRKDFHVILTTDSGELYMLYSLPNSSEVLMDQNNIRQDASLKISVKSMSHAILLY